MSDLIENMPAEWWEEELNININRMHCMTLVGLVDLALRHPHISVSVAGVGKQLGRALLEKMRDDGLELAENVEAVYRKTFEITKGENNGKQSETTTADASRKN